MGIVLLGLLVVFAVVAIVALAAPPERWAKFFTGDTKKKS
jgi:hypothetical protein